MKKITFDINTQKTVIEELPDIEQPTQQPSEPTLEERLAVVEDDTEAIAIVLADIVGVVV